MEGVDLMVMGAKNPSTTWRKRLSDITNITSRSSESEKSCQEKNPISAEDYIAHLLKENNALLRLVGERNKMIQTTEMELHKLKFTLQKANQQNWHLAQANSQNLAELNLGKDRLKVLQHELGCTVQAATTWICPCSELKVLQHELGCTVAALRAKNRELEQQKKSNKQGRLVQEISHETLKERQTKPTEVEEDPSHLLNCKKACSTNRKRTLRSRSLGPTVTTRQETTKENDERRRALRRRSNNLSAELNEPSENLFEIDDVKLSLLRSHEGRSVGPKTSSQSTRNAVTNLAKDEEVQREWRISPHSQDWKLSRLSVGGRPMRRAAEKVCSYKEVPLNIKMRRAD